ncbi:MAG: hypothetical protein JO332_06155 [Planctomycetaceae bacterium]|nr:hypothetical protein [Planctomycetaceae bacterium]
MRLLLALAVLLPNDAYLPLKEGAQWTYQVEDLGAGAVNPPADVVAVVGAETEDWLEVSNYLGYRRCWLRSTETDVQLKLESRAEAPALTILKASAKVGETWTGTLGSETLTFTLRGEERLDRGDTRITTLHVEFSAAPDRHPGHQPTRGDVWFAAGLGVVRAQVTTDLDCHTATSKVYTLKP